MIGLSIRGCNTAVNHGWAPKLLPLLCRILLWACGNHTEWRNTLKVSPIHVKSFRRIWHPCDVVRNLMFNLDVNRSIWKGPHVSLICSNTLKFRDHSVSFTVSNEGPPMSMSSISSAVFPSTDGDFLVLHRYAYFRLSTMVFWPLILVQSYFGKHQKNIR